MYVARVALVQCDFRLLRGVDAHSVEAVHMSDSDWDTEDSRIKGRTRGKGLGF